MSDKTTLQDVINHMSNGFGRMEVRFGRLETRMDGLEGRMDGLEERLTIVERRIDDLVEQVTALRGDLHASMQDIGVIKEEQVVQNSRQTELEVGVSAA